jgi:hypothetical protein
MFHRLREIERFFEAFFPSPPLETSRGLGPPNYNEFQLLYGT